VTSEPPTTPAPAIPSDSSRQPSFPTTPLDGGGEQVRAPAPSVAESVPGARTELADTGLGSTFILLAVALALLDLGWLALSTISGGRRVAAPA
jgi:hypothetical protein